MEFDTILMNDKYKTIAADLEGVKLTKYNFSENQIIFFGNESKGLSKKLSSKIDEKITIERFNKNVDSLNLAISVGIVLSELTKKNTN